MCVLLPPQCVSATMASCATKILLDEYKEKIYPPQLLAFIYFTSPRKIGILLPKALFGCTFFHFNSRVLKWNLN
jgi:hypothetical protein